MTTLKLDKHELKLLIVMLESIHDGVEQQQYNDMEKLVSKIVDNQRQPPTETKDLKGYIMGPNCYALYPSKGEYRQSASVSNTELAKWQEAHNR